MSESITSVNDPRVPHIRVMPDIIVTKLTNEQTLIVDMVARRDVADKDVRWSAVSNIGFKPVSDGLVRITVRSIGIYTPEQLVEIALEIYEHASVRE